MRGKRGFLLFCLLVGITAATNLGAEEFFTANDLEPAQITATKAFGSFVIFARSDKGVTIEAISAPRLAADGEVFNKRIKLNGGGAVDYRSIHFTVTGPAEVLIYTNSSSKTDARSLALIKADGTAIAELVAPPDDEKNAGMVKVSLPGAGEYALFSKNSGINIYQIFVK